jgi:hypothetical protein
MKVRRAASLPLTAAVRSQLEFGWAAHVNPCDHGDPKRLSYASDLMSCCRLNTMRGPQLFPHSKHPNGVAAKIKPLWQIYTNTYDFSVFVGLKKRDCSPFTEKS